jgi:hypothetical protein
MFIHDSSTSIIGNALTLMLTDLPVHTAIFSAHRNISAMKTPVPRNFLSTLNPSKNATATRPLSNVTSIQACPFFLTKLSTCHLCQLWTKGTSGIRAWHTSIPHPSILRLRISIMMMYTYHSNTLLLLKTEVERKSNIACMYRGYYSITQYAKKV